VEGLGEMPPRELHHNKGGIKRGVWGKKEEEKSRLYLRQRRG